MYSSFLFSSFEYIRDFGAEKRSQVVDTVFQNWDHFFIEAGAGDSIAFIPKNRLPFQSESSDQGDPAC